jgi:hypothetical protein
MTIPEANEREIDTIAPMDLPGYPVQYGDYLEGLHYTFFDAAASAVERGAFTFDVEKKMQEALSDFQKHYRSEEVR